MRFLCSLLAATLAFAFAPKAEAQYRSARHQHTYVSNHRPCGCAVYTQRFVRYYDRCGRPVFGHRVLPVRHNCRPAYAAPRHYHPRARARAVHRGHAKPRGFHIGPVIVARPVPQGRCR